MQNEKTAASQPDRLKGVSTRLDSTRQQIAAAAYELGRAHGQAEMVARLSTLADKMDENRLFSVASTLRHAITEMARSSR